MGLAKNSIGTFISQIITLLLQLFIGVMTARFLGTEGRGRLYLLLVSISICVTIGNFGLGQASIYFIGKDRKCLPAILGNLLVATAAISIVLGSVGWFFLQRGRADIYAQFPLWMWVIMACLLPITLLQSLLMQVLSGILRINEINIVDLTRGVIHLSLFAVFVILIGLGIQGAFLAYALSACFATSSFSVLVLYHGARPRRPDSTLLGASLAFGLKAYLSDLLRVLNLRLDAFLIASLAAGGIAATGVYSVSTSVAELLLSIPVAIRLSLFPMVAAGTLVEANRLTSMACRHTMFITIIAALGFGLFGPFLIPSFYGEDFRNAVIPFLILIPGVIMLSQSVLLCSTLDGRGNPGLSSICRAVSLIITVILDLTLIPYFGISGAAVASTCAYTVEFVMAALFFIRYSGMVWRDVFFFQGADFLYYLDFARKTLPSRKTISL